MFEASLIESQKQKGTGKRWISVPLSILLHVLILGTALGLSIWYVEDIPDPPISRSSSWPMP